MSITLEHIRHLSRLSRIRLTDAEAQRMVGELSSILGYIEQLQEIDTEGVPPMSHALAGVNRSREDEAQLRVTRDEALANAPDADEAFFRVPKIIE
ncbi:MAG: Asp-tRNA(Asn)/Glu-tRNA(Gln) amidotransferase subunit GatC [Bacteroidota bacterium]